ncbi:PPC domain-containing DNA-binding protein [Pseudoduganella sp. HUAS MS19]
MEALPLRLNPGDDLRGVVEQALRDTGAAAAYLVQGIGSLSVAQVRYAGLAQPTELLGELEILTVAGTVAPDGAHLHMMLSDARGRVLGGHVGHGCIVRTTAELLLVLLPAYQFSREHDPLTGFAELAIRHTPGQAGG